jgi:DNA-binding transcriptional LysR family regulator
MDENLKKLDLFQLKCLSTLVSQAHVTRAAEQLGLSQPAMSAVLSKLRRIFQNPLLVRTTKGMVATPVAIEIAAHASNALIHVELALNLNSTFNPADSQTTFKIGATESVAFVLMPLLVSALEAEAPHIRILVVSLEPSRVREQLEDGEIDLVVAYLGTPPEGLYTTSLYQQVLKVVASKSHPVIQGTLSLRQYIDAGHIYYKPRVGASTIEDQVDEAFTAVGATRTVKVTVPSAMSSPQIAANSCLLATLTLAVAREASRAYNLQILEPPLPLKLVHVSMYWHERTHAMVSQTWFRQFIKKLF